MKRNLYLIVFIFSFSFAASAQIDFNSNFFGDSNGYGSDLTETLKVYPNPATAYFSVSDNESILKVELYNIVGRKLKSFTMQPGMKYDVSELNNGMYLVRLIDGKDKVVKTLRLQKE